MVDKVDPSIVSRPVIQPAIAAEKGAAPRGGEAQKSGLAGAGAAETAETGLSLVQAVEQINEFFQIAQRTLHFRIDEETGRTVVTVMNGETDEVVRQIPSEEVLHVAARLNELKGLLLSAEA